MPDYVHVVSSSVYLFIHQNGPHLFLYQVVSFSQWILDASSVQAHNRVHILRFCLAWLLLWTCEFTSRLCFLHHASRLELEQMLVLILDHIRSTVDWLGAGGIGPAIPVISIGSVSPLMLACLTKVHTKFYQCLDALVPQSHHWRIGLSTNCKLPPPAAGKHGNHISLLLSVPPGLWKSLNFNVPKSRPWKYLKMKVVLKTPGECLVWYGKFLLHYWTDHKCYCEFLDACRLD